MSTDFSTMTDHELRKWIATRLGWRFEVKDYLITAIHPDGYHYPCDLFWPNAYAHVPDWPTSVDTALTLIPTSRAWAVSPVHRTVVDFEVYPDDLSREGGYRFDEIITVRTERNKLARAICEAWCLMAEREGKE